MEAGYTTIDLCNSRLYNLMKLNYHEKYYCNSGKLFFVPYAKGFKRITRF